MLYSGCINSLRERTTRPSYNIPVFMNKVIEGRCKGGCICKSMDHLKERMDLWSMVQIPAFMRASGVDQRNWNNTQECNCVQEL